MADGAGIPGRRVFFSDDHQLNQRRLPDVNTNIYGPVLYSGGGLGVKLSLLEFDQEKGDKLADTLLKSIAELGTRASSGVPGYLQEPLTSLFQSALQGARSKDDLFGQITFVLDDRTGANNEPTSPLRTGDIVFIRQSDRARAIPWDTLCYRPHTAELYERIPKEQDKTIIDELPPKLNYVVISLVKNAGADAGRIQDAFTYERFVAELSQRKSQQGLISGVEEVTLALQSRAAERELFRQIEVLEVPSGNITELERFDAAAPLGKVLYASMLGTGGFDPESVKPNAACLYLKKEKVNPDILSRLLARLARTNDKHTREKFMRLSTAPKTCVEADKALVDIQNHLLAPK
ncbi:hypothetical protein G4G28_17580 [Massilia sp. Dwa41.01b]|uniref:hypothetical protein n=1 Tax=unclassified Massilia TaxID=2609279 RepID=UPI0016034152|nr:MULTISPECIES: hypothetical protein [unclassified Massilia]QNA89847.1 hypothetical protein G4G28_17580 [Massilia sp. Dwa41.01b]QNB00738.1 hypothetical protein G4G31_21140 [Massilia sp. Se16.2.3]